MILTFSTEHIFCLVKISFISTPATFRPTWKPPPFFSVIFVQKPLSLVEKAALLHSRNRGATAAAKSCGVKDLLIIFFNHKFLQSETFKRINPEHIPEILEVDNHGFWKSRINGRGSVRLPDNPGRAGCGKKVPCITAGNRAPAEFHRNTGR
jgi:hypothetical protein